MGKWIPNSQTWYKSVMTTWYEWEVQDTDFSMGTMYPETNETILYHGSKPKFSEQ